jgi:hypothetical protein
MSDGNVTLPRGNAGCEVLEVALTLLYHQCLSQPQPRLATYVLVRNITTATQYKQDRLPPRARSRLVRQKSGANHANSVDVRVPDNVHGLGATARKASSHDLGGVNIGIGSSSSVLDNPLDRLVHGSRVGRASAVGRTLGDGEEAVAGNLLQKGRVGVANVAASAVAPDEHGELSGASLCWIVYCVVPEGAVRLPCARSVWAVTTALLLDC